MSSVPTTSPAPAPAPPPPRSDFDLVTWFELNWKALAVGAAVISLAVIAYLVMRAQQNAQLASAAKELLVLIPPTGPGEQPVVPDAAKLLALSDRFAGTPAAEQARVLAAGQLFAAGQYAEAARQYAQLVETSEASGLLGLSMLGQAASLEAQGQLTEASSAYDRVISGFGSEVFGIQARLAKARLVLTNQPAQALALLNEVIQNPIAMGFAQAAQPLRRDLLAQHPELDQPATTTNVINVAPTLVPAPAAP